MPSISIRQTFFTAGLVLTASWMAVADDARSTSTEGESAEAVPAEEEEYKPKTKTELRRTLSRMQYDVTQNEATEPAFRNQYWNNKRDGIYQCVVCQQELFSSKTKYKSGTGWPSFYAPMNTKSVGYRSDRKLFYVRIEVHCKRCGAHLGHVFDDGPQPTGKRFCMNSASLKFVDAKKAKDEDAETPKAKD